MAVAAIGGRHGAAMGAAEKLRLEARRGSGGTVRHRTRVPPVFAALGAGRATPAARHLDTPPRFPAPPGICRHIRHGATVTVRRTRNVAAWRRCGSFGEVAEGTPAARHHPTSHCQTPRNLPPHPPRRNVRSSAAARVRQVPIVAALRQLRQFWGGGGETAGGPAGLVTYNISLRSSGLWLAVMTLLGVLIVMLAFLCMLALLRILVVLGMIGTGMLGCMCR